VTASGKHNINKDKSKAEVMHRIFPFEER